MKSALFCPECGHESPADGNWCYRARPARDIEEVLCPVCETRITERPRPADSARGVRTILRDSRGAVPETVERVTELWSASLRLWFDWPSRRSC